MERIISFRNDKPKSRTMAGLLIGIPKSYEFLTPEFVHDPKIYTFGYSGRNDRVEIEPRSLREVKERRLFSLTNFGDPYVRVMDVNHGNWGELLLEHQHGGMDLRPDYVRETLTAVVRCWKRAALVATRMDGKHVMFRYDGKEHSVSPHKP